MRLEARLIDHGIDACMVGLPIQVDEEPFLDRGEIKAFLPSLVHLCLREAGHLGLCLDLVSCRFASLLRAKVMSQSK